MSITWLTRGSEIEYVIVANFEKNSFNSIVKKVGFSVKFEFRGG